MWLRGAQVLDASGRSFRPADVEVTGASIAAIGSAPPGNDGLDLAGSYLLPGMIDCHVHIAVDTHAPDPNHLWHNAKPGTIVLTAASNARRMLECGVTTARDVGGWDYHEIAVREAIDQGQISGPHLVCAGKILSITSATTPYYRGMYHEADGVAEVRKAVRIQLAHGADAIKLLASGAITSSEYEQADVIQYRPDELEEAVRIASDNRVHVAAHAHADEGIRNAAEAGVRSIEHGTYASDATLARMAELGTFLVPTVRTTPAMLSDPALLAAVPEHIRSRYEAAHVAQIDTLKRAHAAGVRIAMGTDAGTPGNHFGDNLHELEVMADEAGMGSAAAIEAATLTAAELLGRSDQLGSIEVGKQADLIAMPRDPLNDITALREVNLVMQSGDLVRLD